MALTEWHTRKIGIDVMYTIAAILGDVITPYTKEILEVLNHCRFDKMKPVREAAIEAINLIKDINPSLDDSQSQDSVSRRDRTTRSTTDKPWKKKKTHKVVEEDPSSFVVYSNKDQDEDHPEKKISSATRKRLEALKAKKNAPAQKPKLNKEKKSIFEQKRNPNFFNKNKKPSEPKIEVLLKEETENKEKEKPASKKSSPKKAHNFYYQEERKEIQSTPNFQDMEDLPNQESNELSDYIAKKSQEKATRLEFEKYDVDDDGDESLAEPVSTKDLQDSQDKKHNFFKNNEFEKYTGDIDEYQNEESDQKVEETPEVQASVSLFFLTLCIVL